MHSLFTDMECTPSLHNNQIMNITYNSIKQFCLSRTIVLTLIASIGCTTAIAGPVDAARGVVERRLPSIASRVTFHEMQPISKNSNDTYEIEAKNGQLTVSGTSAVAMCRGLYDYLKDKCHCLMAWEGAQLNVPERLPDMRRRRVESKVPLRQAFNVVTFSYSTAFWDWKRWEYEIDWMALHGINMPLAMTGQEKIWQNVWKKHFGLTDKELDDFFTGPAFLAWNRMGNIYGNGDKVLNMLGYDSDSRSLPQSFIDNDARMQKLILERETELGMKPVVPGFSGFIPRALKMHNPDMHTWSPTAWNFACKPSLVVHALDPKFGEITKAFMNEYREYYGDNTHYYLIDLFNEIDPPAEITRKDLAEISNNVFKTLRGNDPKAEWVIQGWCFFYQNYWKDKDNTAAYLSGVPDNGMIVIDLNADDTETFRMHPKSVARKKVIWSLLNDNWGQHTPLHGNLERIASMPHKAMKDMGKRMVGLGNSAEGIDNNSVCFELLYDEAWHDGPIDINKWLEQYARQRYGTDNKLATDIWRDMYRLYYRNNTGGSGYELPYQSIPSRRAGQRDSINRQERQLIGKMLAAPENMKHNALFQCDVVDVVKNYVGNRLRASIWKICDATDRKDARLKEYRKEFNDVVAGLDALLATQQRYRLSTWTNAARQYAAPKDADYMEHGARLQVTTWVAPAWQGYARKEWSGLLADYYAQKWNRFFNAIAREGFDQKEFEREIYEWSNNWCRNVTLPEPQQVDIFAEATELVDIADGI